MIEIPLTKGYVTLVDDEDYPLVSGYSWKALKGVRDSNVYAVTDVRRPFRASIYMHKLLMPGRLEVDHIDGNSLNNQRHNLRYSSRTQNSWNSLNKGGKSKYKGVIWHERGQKWNARIRIGGSRPSLGLFDSEEEAALAYDAAVRQHRGKFGTYNFPLDGERSALDGTFRVH